MAKGFFDAPSDDLSQAFSPLMYTSIMTIVFPFMICCLKGVVKRQETDHWSPTGHHWSLLPFGHSWSVFGHPRVWFWLPFCEEQLTNGQPSVEVFYDDLLIDMGVSGSDNEAN